MKWKLTVQNCKQTQVFNCCQKDFVECAISMGQVSPKASKEFHRSMMLKNVSLDNDMKKKEKSDDKHLPIMLSPEKARDTATWIMTTW